MNDWRGVQLQEGDPVVWAGAHGDYVRPAEGVVVGFTPKRVRIAVIRRGDGGHRWLDDQRVVVVSPEMVTVVTGLPVSVKPTFEQEIERARRQYEERQRQWDEMRALRVEREQERLEDPGL